MTRVRGRGRQKRVDVMERVWWSESGLEEARRGRGSLLCRRAAAWRRKALGTPKAVRQVTCINRRPHGRSFGESRS
jgi:hypothetical protein